LLCDWVTADRAFSRVEVWQDDLWRLTTSLKAPVPAFSYLEPKRHIPAITELDGREAMTLGPVLARVTGTIKRITRSELVYVNVFGERVAHLHFNIAPHTTGDALTGGPGMLAPGSSPLEEATLASIARAVRAAMAATSPSETPAPPHP
jgi:diadenosine tetraphosphate (Ap4A) HIT family hydrolase